MQTQWSNGASGGYGGATAGGVTAEDAVLVEGEDELLDEVELALARLDDGTYGHCEECGSPIDDARLAGSPIVRTCGGCVIGGSGGIDPLAEVLVPSAAAVTTDTPGATADAASPSEPADPAAATGPDDV
jgi:hypothetical protein